MQTYGPPEPPRIVIYETDYEWVGPEDDQTAEGDYENAYRRVVFCVPDEWDIEDDKTPVDLAVDVLNDIPAYLEPNVMPGTPSWFNGHEEPDYRTGGWVEHSAHLYGFTPAERDAILKGYRRPMHCQDGAKIERTRRIIETASTASLERCRASYMAIERLSDSAEDLLELINEELTDRRTGP